ncbi:MAG: ABC transporter permease [Oscillospiraceae bacterium]
MSSGVKSKPAQKSKALRGLKRALGDWQLYALILPAVVYLFIFAYIPMYGVQIAFKNYRTSLGIWGSEWVGLEHFIRFITFPNFKMIMMNTLRIGLYSLATFPCAIILALMLNEVRAKKFKKTVQMITYMPYFLSTVVVCSMITLFFSEQTGVINKLIEMVGGTRTDFMTVATYFEDIYVWTGVWQGVGWGAIIYIAALAGIPSELVEAARVDGAGRLRIIWHINIPWILPTIIIMLILSCGGILGVGFEKVYLLQNSLNLSRSQVISTYVYEIGIKGTQFSYSAAIGLFNTVINVILLAIVNVVAKKTSEVSLW